MTINLDNPNNQKLTPLTFTWADFEIYDTTPLPLVSLTELEIELLTYCIQNLHCITYWEDIETEWGPEFAHILNTVHDLEAKLISNL